MKPYEYYDEAEVEYDEALATSRAMNPAVAVEFQDLVDQVLGEVCSGLITAARFEETECREQPLTRFPFSIIYLDDPDAIRIVAFAHHKRRRGYWKSRLRRP